MNVKCSSCGEEKPVDGFFRNPKTGRRARRCLDCGPAKVDGDEWLYKNINALLHKKMHQARYNAARRGKEFSITIEDLISLAKSQHNLCALSKVKMAHCRTNKWANVSIDRIDNNKGYTPDNIRLVCAAVNSMRNRMSDEELLWWAKQISKGMRNGD